LRSKDESQSYAETEFVNFRFMDRCDWLENDLGAHLGGELGFCDWLPTPRSRETDVDNANTTHGQGHTVLLLLSKRFAPGGEALQQLRDT
jgi:hypothetical protein